MSEPTQPQEQRQACELALNRPQEADGTDHSSRREELDGFYGPLAHLGEVCPRGGKQGGNHAIRAGNIAHDAGVAIDQHGGKVAIPTDIGSGIES